KVNMPTPADMAFWVLMTIAEFFAAYIFLLLGLAREFRLFCGYLLFESAANVVKIAVLQHYGFVSREYVYSYYVAGVLLTVILYASVGELVFRSMTKNWVARHIVGILVAGLVGTILLTSEMTTLRLVFASSDNLFWLSAVIITGLCIWNMSQKG